MSVIPAIWDVEIERIVVWGQLGEDGGRRPRDLISTNRKLGVVRHGVPATQTEAQTGES
jgi:hypothetical protein